MSNPLPDELDLKVSDAMMHLLREDGIGPMGESRVRMFATAQPPAPPPEFPPHIALQAVDGDIFSRELKPEQNEEMTEQAGILAPLAADEWQKHEGHAGSQRPESATVPPKQSSVKETEEQAETETQAPSIEDAVEPSTDDQGWAKRFCQKDPLAWVLRKTDRLSVMQVLRARHGSPVGALAMALKRSKEDISGILARLEALKLVEQKGNPSDSANEATGWYHLTQKGRDVSSYWQQAVSTNSPRKNFWERATRSMIYGDR